MGIQYCGTNRKQVEVKGLIILMMKPFLENALFKIESSLLFDEKQIQISLKKVTHKLLRFQETFVLPSR
jgi:hypothetical protein